MKNRWDKYLFVVFIVVFVGEGEAKSSRLQKKDINSHLQKNKRRVLKTNDKNGQQSDDDEAVGPIDPTQLDEYVLHDAAKRGQVEVVKNILDRLHERYLTAFLNNRDCFGRTPLHLAIMRGHVGVVQQIIGRLKDCKLRVVTAILGAVTLKQKTILHYAADNQQLEIVRMLIEKFTELGAVVRVRSIAAQDEYGLTPLHNAAWQGNEEIAALLLGCCTDTVGAGLAICRCDNEGYTPLHFVAEKGFVKLAALFLEKLLGGGLCMVDDALKAMTKKRKSPRDLAAENDHWETMKLFDSMAAYVRDEKWRSELSRTGLMLK